MNITPLNDRVVIEPAAKEEKTASGIILPDSAQEKPLKGSVIAAGPGKLTDAGQRAEIGVKEGDVVLYGKYAGTEVTVDGRDLVILRADDILAVLED
jgi:chaperonin GroES